MMNDEQPTSEVLAGPAAGPGLGADSDRARGTLTGTGDEAEHDEESAQGKPDRKGSFLTEMAVLFAVALTVALLIKSFVVQPFFIPSGSMETTLLIGDKVLVNKLVYHLRPIQRGDIVVFNGAGSWNSPTPPSPPERNPFVRLYDATLQPLFRSVKGLFGTTPGQTDYIKRVIGIPGDHVVCCNAHGQITVNGVPLHEKSYLYPDAQPSQGSFNIVVPPGRLWVMGDNRSESADSRLHDCAYTYMAPTCVPYDRGGTVPEDKVIGRAFMIVWPPNRFRVLPIPSTFLQPVLTHATASQAGSARQAGAIRGMTAGVPVRPSSPALPLAAGFAVAVPLTVLERRLRLRFRRRTSGRVLVSRLARERGSPRRR